ncbi:MAG: polymerase beta domain protein region [Sediminibacterium sp.]|nr:polymerase beta domain protein region [Sediminibacterium sp.]
MLTRDTILEALRNRNTHFVELGVKRIGLFGSYAKGTAVAASDIDIFVEMPANFANLCQLYDTLEMEFKVKVDIVRNGEHLRKPFLDTIEKEIHYA